MQCWFKWKCSNRLWWSCYTDLSACRLTGPWNRARQSHRHLLVVLRLHAWFESNMERRNRCRSVFELSITDPRWQILFQLYGIFPIHDVPHVAMLELTRRRLEASHDHWDLKSYMFAVRGFAIFWNLITIFHNESGLFKWWLLEWCWHLIYKDGSAWQASQTP